MIRPPTVPQLEAYDSVSDPRNQKELDLEPHRWQSDREKPKEPMFGPGLPWFLAFVVGIVIAAFLHDYSWTVRLTGAGVGIAISAIVQAIWYE